MTAHDKNDKEWNINKDEVVRELTEANLRVDDPVVEELVRQYPEYEHQIRQIIMDTQAVDRLVPWLLLCLIMVIIIAVSLVLFKN